MGTCFPFNPVSEDEIMATFRLWCMASLSVASAWGMTLTVAASQPPEPKEPPEVSQARQVLLKSLDRFRKEAPDMQPVVLAHPSLEALFPKCVFFVVRFRQFPVGRVPPQGLDVSNVFVVMPGKEPLRIGKSEQLQKFFRDQAQPVTEEKHARQAVQAWLVLLHELHQDGFYQFEVLEKEITVQREGGGWQASGRSVVMRGGNGQLQVSLGFDARGRLSQSQEQVQLQPGPRPICQARKLLDPDPVVRRMAEQELLYLGRMAQEYLFEQRQQVSPELRQAIDRLWQRIVQEDR